MLGPYKGIHFPVLALKAYGGVVQLLTFITSALYGGEWSATCTGYSEKAPGTHSEIGGPRAGLDV